MNTTACIWLWLHLGQIRADFQHFAEMYVHMCPLSLLRNDGAHRDFTVVCYYKQWFLELRQWERSRCSSCYNCVNSLRDVSGCQAAGVLGSSSGNGSIAGCVGNCCPVQWAMLQHPHYPHSSKGSPEWSFTSHKRLYRLVCRSVSWGPLYLSASSSVMKRPSAGRVSRFPAAGISSSSHQDFN